MKSDDIFGAPSEEAKYENVLGGLERMAGKLDGEDFPGEAWSGRMGRRSRRAVLYTITGALIAAAAVVALLVHFGSAAQPSHMLGKHEVPGNCVVANPALPRIILVEDVDSYSVIDLSAGPAIVSYYSKDDIGAPPSLAIVGGGALYLRDFHHQEFPSLSTQKYQKETSMKCLGLLTVLLALPCAVALADNTGGGNPAPGGGNSGGSGPALIAQPGTLGSPGGGGWAMGKPADAAKMYIQSISGTVALTDDQVQQINDIFADRAKQLADFNTQNADKLKAAGEAMSKAFSAHDQDAMNKAQQDYVAAYAPMNEIMSKSSARLDKVLTPAQKAQLADARLTAAIKMMASPAVLTENQIKAIKSAPNVTENTRQSYQAIQEALSNVLTPQQKTAITKGRAVAAVKMHFYRAKLTADQLAQMDAACDQIVKDSSLDEKAAADALLEKTKALLTPEQNKAMESTLKVRDGFSIPETQTR